MMHLFPFKKIPPKRWQILESLASRGFRKWKSEKGPPKPMPKRLVDQGLLRISNTRRRRRKPRSNVGRVEDPDRITLFTSTDTKLGLRLNVLQVLPSTMNEEGRPKPPLVEVKAVPSTPRELQTRDSDPVQQAQVSAGNNSSDEELKTRLLLPTTFKNSIAFNTFEPEKIGWAPPRLG